MKSHLTTSSSVRKKLLNVRLDTETREHFRRLARSLQKKESELLRELILLSIENSPNNTTCHSLQTKEKAAGSEIQRATVWMPGVVLKGARSRATTRGMSLSRWIAALVQTNLLKIPVMATEELSTLRDCNYELAAIGRNLNQIARVLNADGTQTSLMTVQMIQALNSSMTETQQAIRALVKASNNIWSVKGARTD